MKELDNGYSLLCEIVWSDSKTSFAVVTIPMTVALIEVFAKELKLHLSSTEERFLTILKDRVEGVKILLLSSIGILTSCKEQIICLSICVRVIQNALRHQLISTCSPTFLDVTFETLRSCSVNDESYISLVDSHSKRNRCDDDLNFVLHPFGLDGLSLVVWDVCVVEVTLDAMASFE